MDIAKDLNIARYTASREISKLSTGFKYKTSDGKEGLFEGSNLVSVKSDEDQFNKLVSLTASGFKCINKLIV